LFMLIFQEVFTIC